MRTHARSRRFIVQSMAPDGFNLKRFIAAQDAGGTYERVVAELRAGRKASHWMWFVFPQLAGLGRSAMAERYAISSLEEARAYLADPVLGRRLVECARIVAGLTGRSAVDIFGEIDAIKLRSCMTLYALAVPGEPAFGEVLDRFFDGSPDPVTAARV